MEISRDYQAPGVYREEKFLLPRGRGFRTGVPVFLGRTRICPTTHTGGLSVWAQFEDAYGKPIPGYYLGHAVRGFFENGGTECYVVPLASAKTKDLQEGLRRSELLTAADLVCAPDLFVRPPKVASGDSQADQDFFARVRVRQQLIVQHCSKAGRFAILDTDLQGDWKRAWEQWSWIDEPDGALYYPWVKVRGFNGPPVRVPPCGHIAGVYARSDRTRGVHKAPANEVLHGVLDLAHRVSTADQEFLNPKGINCLRAFPNRGIRVWGARTLAGHEAWRYVNVRRVFTTAIRWIQWNMWDVVFEPNNATLWARIERELGSYFTEQYRRGALVGRSPQEAFYIKCDAETNPPESREAGRVVTEIGLATTPNPFEFVVVRLVHAVSGVTISGPVSAGQSLEGA